MSAGKLDIAAYYSVSNGKICRQFKNPTANSITRVNKNNKTVHEEFYDYLDGQIVGITTKDSEYGRFWVITLHDGITKQILQLNYSSGYSQAFLKMLPNIQLDQKVVIIPKMSEENGKKKSTLFITQNGTAVKWFYTKDEPNGLPPLSVTEGKGKDRGKKVYDDSDMMDFLENMVEKIIVPELRDVVPTNLQSEDLKEQYDGTVSTEEEDEVDPNLPF